MADEGRGRTILTRALQLVSGTTKQLGIQTLLSPRPFEKWAQKIFSPPLVFLPSPF